MCGIVGICDLAGSGRADPALVRAMSQVLVHRGPDDEGLLAWPPAAPRVALGVRRLSIIDRATGAQPVFNEDRSVGLVFNGEIYNFVELRDGLERRGHRFRTRTDTETLVHLYEDHGLDLFPRLRGMYAFALWDSHRERLVLAVDHVGIKPLYVAEQGGRLLFASEPKALLVDTTLPRRVNVAALDTFLTFGYMIGEDTLYEGIRRLPPGHALVVEGGQVRRHRHWRPTYPALVERPGDLPALEAELRERLRESVRLHLRSDVPLGLFLSGGVDSASLLALMSGETPGRIRTYAVGYEPAGGARPVEDETDQARRVAAHFGSEHHELVLSPEEWWRTLLAYVYYHDEPNANPAVVSLQALAGTAARHVRVVLNGTGGDELFCGYPWHAQYAWMIRNARRLDRLLPVSWRQRLVGEPWKRLEALYPRARRLRYVGALPGPLMSAHALSLPLADGLRRLASYEGLVLSDGWRRRLYGPEVRDVWTRSRHKEQAFAALVDAAWTADPRDVAHALVIGSWLPGNGLLSLDKVTMAHSVETRVPFFDPALLGFAMRLPAGARAAGDKALLRRAMRGVLPDFALRRPKRPFGTPLGAWLDRDLAGHVRAVLHDEGARRRSWFSQAGVDALLRRHAAGRAEHSELIFRLVLFELWQRATIDAPPHVPTVTVAPAAADGRR
jgi:asparagine synthase (glutamine-hydrolysing)